MTIGSRVQTTHRVYDYTERRTVVRCRVGTVKAVYEGEVLVLFDDLVQTLPSGLITETSQSAWVQRDKVQPL